LSVLRIEDVSRRFRTVRALERISTSVEAGEIRGLIGPNGAGKTTLINIVTGFLPPTSGHIYLADRRIDRTRAHERVALGLARTFQTPQLCAALTVRDNIVIGAHRRLASARFRTLLTKRRISVRALRAEAEEVGRWLGLGDVLGEPAGALSYGHTRLLEIGRAVIQRPRVLLLDEPVAGMNEAEGERVAEILRALRDDGTTILLVEHDMPFVMQLCDRLTVLDYGNLLADGTPAEIRANPDVQAAYLGKRRSAA